MSNDEIIKYSRLTSAIFICLVSNLLFVLHFFSFYFYSAASIFRVGRSFEFVVRCVWAPNNTQCVYVLCVVVVVRKIAPKNYLSFWWWWRVHVKWNNVCAHIFLTLWFSLFARVLAACLLLPPHSHTDSHCRITIHGNYLRRTISLAAPVAFFFPSNIWLKSLFWHSTQEKRRRRRRRKIRCMRIWWAGMQIVDAMGYGTWWFLCFSSHDRIRVMSMCVNSCSSNSIIIIRIPCVCTAADNVYIIQY